MAAIQAADGLYDKVYASTTFLGIGERAGNAETEKIILNLYLQHGVKKFEGKTRSSKQPQTSSAKQPVTWFHLTKPSSATTVSHMNQASTPTAS